MATFHELSTAQLRQALQIREQIEGLQRKLGALLGGGKPTEAAATTVQKATRKPAGKRTMSAAGRAKIAAAQKARWAKVKETNATPVAKTGGTKAPKKRRTVTIRQQTPPAPDSPAA